MLLNKNTMKRAIFGFGGHAKEVGSFLPDCIFVVDDEYCKENAVGISKISPKEYELMICVGDSKSRQKIFQRLNRFNFFSYIHPSSIVGNDLRIGDGSFVGPFSVLTTNISIGNHALINRFNSVGHDVVAGDYLSMMPGAIISGNCKLGNSVYMGNNSCIKENLTLCNEIILGMNTGVVKSVTKSGIYIGTPARKIN